jgi:hypothetical protein
MKYGLPHLYSDPEKAPRIVEIPRRRAWGYFQCIHAPPIARVIVPLPPQ